MKRVLLVFCLFVLGVFVRSALLADTVYLNSGKKLEGQIWHRDEEKVVIISDTQRGLEPISVSKGDIQRIDKDEGREKLAERYVKFLYYYQEGKDSYKSARYYKSLYFLKKAVELNPKSAQVHYNLGLAYYRLKLYKEALEAFNMASELLQDLPDKSGQDLLFLDEIKKTISRLEKLLNKGY